MIINKKTCPTCGQSVNPRQISLFLELVDSLRDVYNWCVTNKVTEFERKDIKHLLKSDSVIARFGDWIHFGEILTKDGKGKYKINMIYARAFLTNAMSIPTNVYHDPLTGEYEYEDKKYLRQIKGLSYMLDENKEYIVEYRGK